MLLKLIDHQKKDKKILDWELFAYLESDTLRQAVESDVLEVDLSGFQYINHDGLVWLGTICLSRATLGKSTYIILPEDADQLATLEYLGFRDIQVPLNISFLNEYLFLELPKKYTSKKETTIHLQKIKFVTGSNWPTVLHTTSRYLSDYLTSTFSISSGDGTFEELNPFIDSLREFILNIVLHGGMEAGNGMGLVSCPPAPRSFDLIRYCCSDIGRGFKTTLESRHNQKVSSEGEAILDALLFRFFYKDKGVLGLYPTLGFIRDRSGKISLRSGDALVFIDFGNKKTMDIFDSGYGNPNKDWLRKIAKIKKLPAVLGTHICVDLHLPSSKKGGKT